MLSHAERIKLYGSAEAVAEADRRIAEAVDAWPPLTQRQKDRLAVLLRPAPAEAAPRHSSPGHAKAA